MDPSHAPRFDLLAPTSPDFATLPIAEAFDWSVPFSPDDEGEWYLVCFRSVRRTDADERLLTELDERAHAEAASSPGFAHYFKGPLSERGECLSFCLWESRPVARAAAARPLHRAATRVTNQMYASYQLEFHRVRKQAGARAAAIEPYDGPASVRTSEEAAVPA